MNKTNKTAYVDAEAVARRYDVHPKTVRDWARNLGCPHVRVGGVYRFQLDAVQQWAEDRTVSS